MNETASTATEPTISIQHPEKSERQQPEKTIQRRSTILFWMGVITILSIALVGIWSLTWNVGERVAFGMLGGMLGILFLAVVGVVGMALRISIGQLYRQLHLPVAHDKYYFLGLIGMVLCILPITAFWMFLLILLLI